MPVPLAALPLAIFLAAAVAAPLATVARMAVTDAAGAPTLDRLVRALTVPPWSGALGVSVELAVLATGSTLILAWPVAGRIAAAGLSGRRALLILVLVPFWMGFLVRALAWGLALARGGPVNATLTAAGLIDHPIDLMPGFPAVLVATVHALLPGAILLLAAARLGLDPTVGLAARGLGCPPRRVGALIVLPLLRRPLVAAATLAGTAALGLFLVPALLGAPRDAPAASLIVQAIQEFADPGTAAAAAMVLTLGALLLMPALDPGGDDRPGRLMRATTRAVDRLARLPSLPIGAAWMVIAFLILPTLTLLPVSIGRQRFIGWPPDLATLDWYRQILLDPGWRDAALRSVALALMAATLATALAAPAARALAQADPWARRMMVGLALLPLIVPRVAHALGLFHLFAPLGLTGTPLGLVIGQTAAGVPFALLAALPAFATIDPALVQAARGLGCGRWGAFRRVELPLALPGVAAGAALAFVTALDDLTYALFLAGGTLSTLPLKVWEAAQYRLDPSVAAAAILLALGVTVPALLATRHPHPGLHRGRGAGMVGA